ncbi:phosphatidylinositol 4-phosphate 5-kinase-like [Cydia fagiglandana]|uniref:phosphatidylinositol 4-phosphate 5-kinase-like n=1 Tax=Cydia fagiglandana TaxID=1458189 RepID=UPI002FEE0558
MQCFTLALFCVLCSFTLVSSKYNLHYRILRTGGDGDDAIDDNVSVDDDAGVILSEENDRNEGVDDDELDSNEGKKLSAANDENDADNDDDNVTADNNQNDAVSDDENGSAGNDKNDAVGDDDNVTAGNDNNDAVGDDENGSAGNDKNDAVGDDDDSAVNDDDATTNKKIGGDDVTAINDSNEGNQEIEDDEPSTSSTQGKKVKLSNDEMEDMKQYELELEAGDLTEFLGNHHYHEPRYYKDLGRRFIHVYPYKERKVRHRKPSPERIIQFLMSSAKKVLRNNEDRDIVPIMAPADVVVAVMRNGTKKYSSKPSEPTEEIIRQYMLRSGDYWDDVWKEEVNPDTILRTKKRKHPKPTLDIQPFTSKLVPGTKLYDLLARIVKKSPKLLYFINN